MIKQAVKKLNMDDKIYQPKLIKAVISNAKNKMQDAYTFATFARDFKSQNIAKIFEYYENTLNNNNAIDFDDMLMLCVKLLEQMQKLERNITTSSSIFWSTSIKILTRLNISLLKHCTRTCSQIFRKAVHYAL